MSSTVAEGTCQQRLILHESDGLSLSQQLSNAKEMGFSDGDLLSALELREERQGSGGKLSASTPFDPFSSTNAMLDTLREVQTRTDRDVGRCRFPSKWEEGGDEGIGNGTSLSVYDFSWRSSVVASFEEKSPNAINAPSTSSSINRSRSLNSQPQQSSSSRSTLQRLIATFESENHRHFDEYRRLNRALRVELASRREKEHELKCLVEEKSAEVERLSAESNKVEELFRENSRLRVELIEKEELIEQLSLALSDSHSELTSLRAGMADGTGHRESNGNPATLHHHQTLCTICMDRMREVIFMPCLHYSCCKPCAESLDHCGICRLRIMGKIEFFQ